MIFRIHIHTLCEPFIEKNIYMRYFRPFCGMLFHVPSVKMFLEKEHKFFLPGIGVSALDQGDKWKCNGRVSITSSQCRKVTGALPGACSVLA